MSSKIEFTNLVENEEVFEDNEAAFPPAPPSVQRPTAFTSPPQQQPQLPLPTAEGTPLRDTRLKLAHRTEGLRTIILAFAVFSFGLTVALVIELFTGAPAVAPHGGVTSSSELCSNIGVDQLKKGGNAIDAAISVMLCIGLVRPQSAGLGGGGLMLIHDHKTHNTTLFDFRETAPQGLSVSDQNELRVGGRSVGVPGELAGMCQAHYHFGKMAWADLFTPVIKLAEEGWILDEKDVNDVSRRSDVLSGVDGNYTLFRKTIMDAVVGARRRRKDLANLFRRLAVSRDEAYSLFYSGSLASEIVETVQNAGGVMTKDDLKTYKVLTRKPMVSTFRNFHIITFPAPSSGSLLIYMLNELEKKSKEDVGTVDYFANLAEITSRAFKCRRFLGDPGDPQDTDLEVNLHEQLITNKSLAEAETYCDSTDEKSPTEDHGTSHINVIDNDEVLVSVTTSLNYWFGSMLMTPSGILLNNEMDDFDVTPGSPNQEQARKRPLSSMVPTVVIHSKRDCLQRLSIGGTNGTKIPSSIVQTLAHLLIKEDDLATAVEAPKIFCDEKTCYLERFAQADEVAKAITAKGKLTVTIVDEKLSTVGVVLKLNSTVDGYIEQSSYGKSAIY